MNVCICWVKSPCRDSFINGFSKNIFDYYYVSASADNIQQYVADNYNDAVEQAKKDEYENILVIHFGVFFYRFSEYIRDVINAYNSNTISGIINYTEMFPEQYADFNSNNLDNFSEVIKALNLQVTFIGNTEFPMFDSNIEIPKCKRLVVSSGGLNPVMYAWYLKMGRGCKVDIVDISDIALYNAKRWITEWNGYDCISFSEMLKTSYTTQESSMLTRGGAFAGRMQDVLDAERQKGFNEWFATNFQDIEFSYHKHDFFNMKDNKQLARRISNDNDYVFMHMSNIFHYLPTAFYYSFVDRLNIHNNLITILKQHGLDERLLLTYIDPQHQIAPSQRWLKDVVIRDVDKKYSILK